MAVDPFSNGFSFAGTRRLKSPAWQAELCLCVYRGSPRGVLPPESIPHTAELSSLWQGFQLDALTVYFWSSA